MIVGARVPLRRITGGKHTQDGGRRKHIRHLAAWPPAAGVVVRWRPAKQRAAADGPSDAAQLNECTIRQLVDRRAIFSLGTAVKTFGMQDTIHHGGARPCAQPAGARPEIREGLCIVPAAFETGPVTSSERGYFIEKK